MAEELNIDHSAVIWHLRQIGKVKKFGNWVPHEVTKNPKNHCFEVLSSLILPNNNEPFLRLQCPTPCHTIDVSEFEQTGLKVLPHPPYSPDFLLTD